jgi:LmbE family N-acetylglucosaminyl deacetylase
VTHHALAPAQKERDMTRFDADYVPASAMTIFAHPDDAEFGVAGTLARWARAGCEITMVLCTSGNAGTHDAIYTAESLTETREREQRDAADILGVKHVVFLRHDDCQLQPTLDLRRELVRAIRAHRPEVVICNDPTGWLFGGEYINHPDHRAAAQVAIEAVFPCAEMPLLWPEEGLPHKVHAVYIAWAEPRDTWVDITDTIDLKIAALKRHASQMGDWDPTDMIREWARGDAKAGRKREKAAGRAKDAGVKREKDARAKRPKLRFAESYRVMVLQRDNTPPES